MKNFNLKPRLKQPLFANHGSLPYLLQVLTYHFLIYLVFSFGSCKKPDPSPLPGDKTNEHERLSVSKQEAIRFIENSITTAKQNPADSSNRFLSNLHPDYNKLYHRKNSGTDSWNLAINGSPIYHGQKLGYRKMRIFLDAATKQISAEIIEVLPDPIALQLGKIKNLQSFTGKVFRYDLGYRLKGGSIISAGKTTGEIRPGPAPMSDLLMAKMQHQNLKGSSPKDPLMLITESCGWSQE